MEWVGELLRALRDFFPRVFMVYPDEGGVRISFGKIVKTLKPGWYVYWPPVQHVEKIGVTPQCVDLRPQSGLTTDDIDMGISGAILYKISDARKAILDVQDYDRSIQVIALGVILEFTCDHSSTDFKIATLRELILLKVREEASGFGIKIMRVYITDLGKCRNLRILGTPQGVIVDEGE